MPRRRKGPTPKKHRLKLAVIPEPEPGTRTVMVQGTPDTLLFEGEYPNISLLCGSCGNPLAVGVKTSQLHNLVLQCAACSAFNETIE